MNKLRLIKQQTNWDEASNALNCNSDILVDAITQLEAQQTKNAGYFMTELELKETIPAPSIGMWAYVKSSTGDMFIVYREENGAWKSTNTEAPAPNINSTILDTIDAQIDSLERSVLVKQDTLIHYREDENNARIVSHHTINDGLGEHEDSIEVGVNHCINLYSWDDMEGYESSITVKPAQIDIKTYQLNLPSAEQINVGDTPLSEKLPTIVNDLITGGADKALSAEMGKVLHQEVEEVTDALEEHVEERKDDGIELLTNGNLRLTLKGETMEFMSATQSGDPMHYAYVSAGAEYNATDDFILKDAPWKDLVDPIDYKAQWNLDIVSDNIVQSDNITYNGVSYRYAKDTRTSPTDGTQPRYRIVVKDSATGKWVWDDTKVLHLPNHWYLNGLGDLTNREIREWYRVTRFNKLGSINMLYYGLNNIRTANVVAGRYSVVGGGHSCANCGYIETIVFDALANGDNYVLGTNKVRHFIGLYSLEYTNSNIPKGSFSTKVLSTIRLHKCKKNISIELSSAISKATIKQLITTATPTSAITITLHADAYARLHEDTDIVAALEAKNTALSGTGGSISLVSA